jgi:hypothetical protein
VNTSQPRLRTKLLVYHKRGLRMPSSNLLGFTPLPRRVMGMLLANTALYVAACEVAKKVFTKRIVPEVGERISTSGEGFVSVKGARWVYHLYRGKRLCSLQGVPSHFLVPIGSTWRGGNDHVDAHQSLVCWRH